MRLRASQRELGDFISVMRDKRTTYIRMAKNVVSKKTKLEDVKKTMTLSEFEMWKRQYLSPTQNVALLPSLMFQMVNMAQNVSALKESIGNISDQLQKFNDSLSKLKSDYQEAFDSKDFTKAVKLSNDIAQLEETIAYKATKEHVSQAYLEKYQAQMDLLQKQLTDKKSFGVLKLLGIL